MIIYLGVLPAGREDPRLVRLGDGFARIGIVTLIPESPNLKAGKISEEEIEELIAAFDLLSELEYVDPRSRSASPDFVSVRPWRCSRPRTSVSAIE